MHAHSCKRIHTCPHARIAHAHTHTPGREQLQVSKLTSPSRDQCSPGQNGSWPSHFTGRLLPKRLHPTGLAFQASQPAEPCAITAREGLHPASTAGTPIGTSASSPVGGVLRSVPSDAGRRSPFSGGSRSSVAGGAPGVRDFRAPSLTFWGECSAVRPHVTSRPGGLRPSPTSLSCLAEHVCWR